MITRILASLLILAALTGGAMAQTCSGTPNQNTVCAGPSSGGPGFPTFRTLVTADVPAPPPIPAGVDQNILNTQTGNYTVQTTDCGATIQAGTGSSGFFTVTLPGVGGFASTCTVGVINGDTGRGKTLSGFPAPLGGILYPGQYTRVKIVNGAWKVDAYPGRWRLSALTTFFVRPDGSDSNDGLANSAAGAFLTPNAAAAVTSSAIDINERGGGSIVWNHTCASPPCTISTAAQFLQLINVKFVGGVPGYQGDCTTPSNVTLSPAVARQADIQVTYGDMIQVCGFKFAGGANATYGIYVSGGARVIFNNVFECGALSGTAGGGVPGGDCLAAHNSGSGIYLATSAFAVSGSEGAVLIAWDGGVIENGLAVTITFSGTPAWSSAFATAIFGGILSLPSITNSGAATGARFNAQWGGSIYTGQTPGGICTLASTYFNGNANGTLGTGGGNQGQCFGN